MRLSICFLLFLLVSNLFGQNKELQEFYQKVTATYDSLKTYQAELEQINYFANLKVTKKATGRFYYRSGAAAIYYLKPDYQIMIFNQSKVTIYDRNSNTAVISNNPAGQFLTPSLLINEFWQKAARKKMLKQASHLIIELSDLNDDNYQLITIEFNDQLLFERIKIVARNQNQITQVFKKYQLNCSIKDQLFNFKPDKKTKIIKQ